MKILDKEFTPKYGLRAMFIWESMTDKPFEISTLLDTYVFCYACLIANKDNPALDFNEFIDYCDGHPEVINWFNEYMTLESKKRSATTESKKKVTRKAKA